MAKLAVLVSLLFGPASAWAAEPVAGGRYVGECCGGAFYEGYVMVAELRVGPSGQALLGGRRGSYIGCDRDGTLVPLRPKGRVRIEHDGDFSFGGRSRGLKFRVRGRFRSPDLARVTYSVRPRRAFSCPPGPRSLRLHRRAGEPPFSSCASQPAQTVTSSPLARVFAQRMVFRWAFLPFAYGCLYSVDRRVAFGLDGFDEAGLGQALDHFRLAGPYAAYGCGGNLRHGCWASVSVVDLRDGTVLHAAAGDGPETSYIGTLPDQIPVAGRPLRPRQARDAEQTRSARGA